MGTRRWDRVYIAAASSDLERVKRVRNQLVNGGMTCTSRWIDEVSTTGANPSDPVERKRRADSDVEDVRKSQVILFLVPRHPMVTSGAWFELGAAHILGVHLVSSGRREDLDRSVFPALGEEYEDDVDAIIRLLRVPTDTENDERDGVHRLKG